MNQLSLKALPYYSLGSYPGAFHHYAQNNLPHRSI